MCKRGEIRAGVERALGRSRRRLLPSHLILYVGGGPARGLWVLLNLTWSWKVIRDCATWQAWLRWVSSLDCQKSNTECIQEDRNLFQFIEQKVDNRLAINVLQLVI
jgi:hypothetical protein